MLVFDWLAWVHRAGFNNGVTDLEDLVFVSAWLVVFEALLKLVYPRKPDFPKKTLLYYDLVFIFFYGREHSVDVSKQGHF